MQLLIEIFFVSLLNLVLYLFIQNLIQAQGPYSEHTQKMNVGLTQNSDKSTNGMKSLFVFS